MKPAPLVDQADKATWQALVQAVHDAPHGYKAQARRKLEAFTKAMLARDVAAAAAGKGRRANAQAA